MTNALTFVLEQHIFKEFMRRRKAGMPYTQASLAIFAQEKFNLKQAPAYWTVSRLLKNSAQYQHIHMTTTSSCKRIRAPALPHLKTALYKMICSRNNDGIIITGKIIIVYAKKLLFEENKHNSNEVKIQLKF